VTDIVLEFEPPADPISMNDKPWTQRKLTPPWRDTAYMRWCEAHPGVGPSGRSAPSPAVVHVTLPFPIHRTRDPINFARTVKAIVDGLTLAGAWPDDTIDYVTQEIPTLVVTSSLPVLVRISPRPGT